MIPAAKLRLKARCALTGEERKRRYNGFFRGLISQLQERGFDKQRKAPFTSWYNFSVGHGMSSKVQYASSFNRDAKARVELYLDSDKESNKALFDHLYLETVKPSKRNSVRHWTGRGSTTTGEPCRRLPSRCSIEDGDATLVDIQGWMVEKLWNLDRVLGPRLESPDLSSTCGAW